MENNKLLEFAKPLQQYLDENYHHHCAVIVTLDSAKVVDVQESIPLSEAENNFTAECVDILGKRTSGENI